MDAQSLSYWELAVWLTFNPSWDEKVQKLKKLYAEIIDILNDEIWQNKNEKARLLSVAITEAQTAQMWAVKWITYNR